MTGNWLYPLSKASGKVFVDADGNELSDTSFESFRKMMTGNAPTDDRWYLATAYRQVEPGDRMWCYYGTADGDQGIVGVAEITAVEHHEEAGTHDLVLCWDHDRTRRLLIEPVPAARVREFIRNPRSPVWNLDRHPELLDEIKRHAGLSSGRAQR